MGCTAALAAEAPRPRGQICAEGGARTLCFEGDIIPPQARLRGPARCMVSRPAPTAPARKPGWTGVAAVGIVRHEDDHSPARPAPIRGARPQRCPLDALDDGGVPPA